MQIRLQPGRTRRAALVLGLFLLAAASPAGAALPGCGCEPRAELEALRARIAGAADLAAARELALTDVERARGALGVARRVAPGSDRLREAAERIDAYAIQVAQARDPGEVARHFSELVQPESGEHIVGVDGLHDGGDLDVDHDHCHLTTRELVAVVLGLILGILPGLILLVLLC